MSLVNSIKRFKAKIIPILIILFQYWRKRELFIGCEGNSDTKPEKKLQEKKTTDQYSS